MKRRDRFLKYLPLFAIVLMLVLFGATLSRISIDDIINLSPENYVLSVLMILGLYALKSISVVFPLMVLYISTGAILPTWLALVVNAVGLLICVTIPFCIGRFSGAEAVGRLTAKYPKAQRLADFSSQNTVFFSYLLRIINLLPGDLVSMLLGAANLPFLPYAAGSMLGLLPVMIPAVLVGQNLDNPLSAGFILPFVAMVGISLLSTVLYNRHLKKKK